MRARSVREEDLVRDFLIARMKNETELQREFIMEKTSAAEVVKQIVLYERGTQTSQTYKSFSTKQIKKEPTNAISSRGR